MKLSCIDKISIAILNVVALPISILAQESVLPRPFEVYGGTIGVIDAIEVAGAANKTRVFASTDSANSVFYADVDHSSAAPLGTNFIFRVVPDLDANANFGAPNWIAAHQQSGRVFVGCSSGLLSCTTSAGSLITNIPAAISFVLIQGSYLFAINDPGVPETPKTLYYGTLDTSGNLTVGPSLGTNFVGSSVRLAISPVDNKVYVLCNQTSGFVLLKSSDNYNAFTAATTFSSVPSSGVTLSSLAQVTIGPDGRLFLGGGSTMLEMAYSDDNGVSWTNFSVVARSGGGNGLNIVCNGSSSAYEVYYGWVVSSNKGAGTWAQLPRGGFRPNATHVNAGCIKVDPLNSNMIYVTTDKGIGGSTNAGVDVVELNNGLLAFQINDIDALADKSVAWIGSKAGMRRASNFNTTPVWTDGEFPDAIVYACAIDSNDSSGMTGYAGSCRLYKTTTGGGSNGWAQVWRWEDYGLTDGEIRAIKANGNFVALGYYSYAATSPSGGVWYSSNAGSNWTAAITNINVNDMLMRQESGADVLYAAVSKSTTAERGGIYRIESSTAALDMTNEVNIRKMAEDSVGGIYASGTLPETSGPGNRHCVVAYYRDTNSTWSMLTTNGLPGDFNDGDVLGRGLGPVITVGKDSATNDVPVLAVQRTIYYLPHGGSTWVTITNYPNGTQIKTLFYDELMVGTTIGLYSQGLNAQPAGPTQTVASVTGDIDGDQLADLISVTNSNWYVWFSTAQYLVRGGPYVFNVSGTPVTGDIDGDGLADIISVTGTSWYVWFSTAQYLVRGGPYTFDVAGTPVTGDIDGDGLADIISVTGTSWYVWFSTAQYLVRGGPYTFDVSGTPATGDIDGDGLADIISVSGSSWYVWFSTAQYLVRGGPYDLGISGTPTTGDIDGDGLADLIEVVGSNWYVWFSTAQYLVRGGPYVLSLP